MEECASAGSTVAFCIAQGLSDRASNFSDSVRFVFVLCRLQKQLAVLKVQATWRMVQARRQLAAAKGAAVTLQAAWRGRQQRIR
jgi:hypothetical protein